MIEIVIIQESYVLLTLFAELLYIVIIKTVHKPKLLKKRDLIEQKSFIITLSPVKSIGN